MRVQRSVLAPLAYRLVTRAPASAVGRARLAGRLAPLFETGFGALGVPLYGEVVPVANGPGAGLRLFAERRSLVWISGRAEPDVQETLSRLLTTGASFVDVGASIGFFTLLAARRVGPSGTVVAFEPQPEAAASVRRNAALNEFENVSVVGAALTSVEGDGFLAGAGKATAHLAHRRPVRGHMLRVDCTTLDRFLAGRPEIAPTLVKIDVEGHEADVLDGMHDTLLERRPAVLIECHGDVRSVLLRLEDARFAVSVVGSDLRVSEAPGTAHLLATPSERAG